MLYLLAKWIIILEFILITIATVAVYTIKQAIARKKERDKQLSQRIKKYLTSTTYRHDNNLPRNWKRLRLLLPIVSQLDLDKNEHAWYKNRRHFVVSVMLPLARASTTNNYWASRLYASQTFAVLSENTDESYILKLASDEIPLVRFSALSAAILFGSEAIINLIITQMAKEPWRTQSVYLSKFDNVPLKTRHPIENFLKTSPDINIRITCYKVLLKYPPIKPSWDIETDIKSKTLSLKLSALKLLAHINHKSAIPILIDALNDTHWQVQTISMQCLGDLKAFEALPKITNYLNNSNQWVAVTAAETLYRLGDQGIAILKSQRITYDPACYNIVHHVLDSET
ncbi:MAG: hypothetical protein RJA83_83 [Pseudomonadota bacterium]|jgi:HEAT repeat protein